MKRKFDYLEYEELGHGIGWFRGPLLGKGGFGSVFYAELKTDILMNGRLPDLMTIKSAKESESISLRKEKQVLYDLRSCPYIINCYGDEITKTEEEGLSIYNLLLEYASGDTLSSLIKKSGAFGTPESHVRTYTKCLLKGIDYIHTHKYVHCDLKPDNILLVLDKSSNCFVPKIGDFGLAKSYKKMKLDTSIGGTTLYMAPETVIDRIQGPPCDIWALGCIVYEMLTGRKVWNPKADTSRDEILRKISDPCELPKIPTNLSQEAKEFLKACLVRNPMHRFTARMLLILPLVSSISDDVKISAINGRQETNWDEESYIPLCLWSSYSLSDCSTSQEREEESFDDYPRLQVELKRRRCSDHFLELPKPRLQVA